jgi:hypothetical protein
MIKTFLFVLATVFTVAVNGQGVANKNTPTKNNVVQEQVVNEQTASIPATLLLEKGMPNGKLRWVKGMSVITFKGNQIIKEQFFVDTRSSNPDKRYRALKEDEKVWAFTTVNYSKVGN